MRKSTALVLYLVWSATLNQFVTVQASSYRAAKRSVENGKAVR